MANSGLLNTYYMPSHKSESSVNLDTLIGGLNLYELPYRLGVNETPDIVNLVWRDGAIASRDAQAWLCSTTQGIGYSCFDGQYYGREFYHIGNHIYAVGSVPERKTVTFSGAGTHTIPPIGFTRVTNLSDPTARYDGNRVILAADSPVEVEYLAVTFESVCDLSALYAGYTPSRGVFLRYQDDLIYKARGIFVRISYADGAYTAKDILADAYVPITLINADAATGTGDQYQPENRLSPKKTVWYEAAVTTVDQTGTLSSSGTSITVSNTSAVGVVDLYVGGTLMTEGIDYVYDRTNRKITGLASASSSRSYVVKVQIPTNVYYLPVKGAASVSVEARLTAGGSITKITQSTATLTSEPTSWNSSWDGGYVFWPPTGKILFKTAPYVATPRQANSVRITYELENAVARDAIMSCKYATVYGGDTNMCMVLGGSEGQPNAIFWNGNNVAMDITYFPIESYNLAGDNSEPVTGFGRQQNMLVIFKEHSVSKASMDTQTINDRVYIAMSIVDINSRIGCDLPYTIQLIDNNLVFCNSQAGLHVLLDTSAANENNIRGISKKVNGTPAREGILKKVSRAGAERCVSYDDDSRYWLVIGDEVFVWDYVLSGYKEPSFFYLTNFPAVSFSHAERDAHYLRPDGRIVAFGQFNDVDNPFGDFAHTDFGAPIQKRYTTPILFFDDSDKLKDVNSIIFTVSADTWSRMRITYTTDCETREDLTEAYFLFYRFLPRNLRARCLTPKTYSATFRRKPGCRHVRYFSMTIESAEVGMDMSLVSAQIFYRKQGRDR